MLIKTIPVGQLETNCYVVINEASLECVVIDPGDESNTILDYMESNHLRCRAILLTHGHYDHVGAVDTIAEETGAVVYMNERDDYRHAVDTHLPYTLKENGRSYDDGDTIEAAGLRFDVIGTPGLFKGSCGRTDLPGGDMQQELASLRKICELPGDYEVYPGHMDSSTLERERSFNYYCRAAMRS